MAKFHCVARKFSHVRVKWLKIAKFHFVAWNASKTQIFISLGQMLENFNVSLRGTECIQNPNFHIFGSNDWKLQSSTSWHGKHPKLNFSHIWVKWLKIVKFHFVTRNASKMQFFTSPSQILDNSKVSLCSTEIFTSSGQMIKNSQVSPSGMECIQNANFWVKCLKISTFHFEALECMHNSNFHIFGSNDWIL